MKWFLGIFAVVSLSVWGILGFVFPRPEGHWHVYGDILFIDTLENYSLLDFDGNQILFEESILGGIYRFQKEMSIGVECIRYDFEYYFSGDSLILLEEWVLSGDTTKSRSYALKSDFCLKKEHLFRHSYLDIELYTTEDTLECERIKKLSLVNGIEVGKTKAKNSDDIKMYQRWGDKEVTEEDIDLVIERHKITVPEQNHVKIQLAFYADKKTKIKHLKPILQKLAEIPDRPKVVLVFQYNPHPDAFELFGKEVIFEGVDWENVEDEMFFADYVLGQN